MMEKPYVLTEDDERQFFMAVLNNNISICTPYEKETEGEFVKFTRPTKTTAIEYIKVYLDDPFYREIYEKAIELRSANLLQICKALSELEKRFTVVTLCGSTKFKEEYIQANIDLTMKGYIVLACPIFHHADGLEISDEEGQLLHKLHKQRIDMSSEIYVINKDGYIGEWTREEIDYAISTGKSVKYMFDCEG